MLARRASTSSSSASAAARLPPTISKNASLSSSYSLVSVRAITVAVRGPSGAARSRRRRSPRRSTATGSLGDRDVELAVGDDVEVVAVLALAHERRRRPRTPLGSSPRASRSSCGGLSEREGRRRAKQGDLVDGHGRAAVDVQHAPSRDQSHRAAGWRRRRSAPRLRPGEGDEDGREDRADRERRHREPLEHAEDTREELGRSCALQERAPGDVEQAAPGTRRPPGRRTLPIDRRVPGERPRARRPTTATPASRGRASCARPTSAAVAAIPSTPPAPNAAFR